MIILVDMDGVIADFEHGFHTAWRRAHPRLPHVPVEARTTFRLIDEYPAELTEQVREVYCAPGFFLGLPPVAGACAALEALLSLGHEVRLCTSPLRRYRHCVGEKYAWAEAHLGPEWTERLILTRDKTLVRGDLLIDDNPRIHGLMTPAWEHLVYDRPYNRGAPGRRLTWATWREVLLGERANVAA